MAARPYLLDTNILSQLVRQPQGPIARAIEAVCVTANVTEFKRVPGVKVENWLA